MVITHRSPLPFISYFTQQYVTDRFAENTKRNPNKMRRSSSCFILYFSLFILLVTNGARLYGQMVVGLNTDSLKQVIRSTADDTNKVNNFIMLGQQYENNIPDSAIYFYKQANQLSTTLNYPAGIIRYINNYTAVLNVQGKYDESLKLHRQALALCDQYGLNDLRVKALINIGAVYQYKEDYKAAADHYLKSLPILERTADPRSLSLVYGNLCGLYRNLNQPRKALEYAEQSVKFGEKSKEPYTIGRAYHNMANALKDNNRDKEREVYLNRAYQIGEQINDIDLQETALINLGDMLSKTATPDVYMYFFRKALPLADSLGDVYGKSLALEAIAAGLFTKKQYKQAEQKALEALVYARDNAQRETESKTLLLMSDIKIAIGDLAASARYRHEYDSVSASVVNEGLVKNVQELETRYEVEKKQSQLLKQNLLLVQKSRETLQQRTWLWIMLGGLLVMGLFLFWGVRFYRQRQLLNQKKVETLQAEQENIRLKSLLEGQMLERHRISQEMHDDMGSGLTSILFMSRTLQGQDKVAIRLRQTAEQLIQKMNEIIWIMNHEQDTLDSLVAYMRLHIAEALDNAGIDYAFTVTETLPALALSQEYRRNLYLSAKEAIHNTVKHAGATQVTISITVTDRLEVIIEDNGRGLEVGKTSTLGNGLRSMQRRLEQVGGTFSIGSTQQGTRVVLTAPLPI